MPRLIFIGGAPGIGKTTVARELLDRLDNSAWLDGDEVWHMNPFTVNDTTKRMVEENIQFVLRSYLEADLSHVLLSWVLHTEPIIGRLLRGLDDLSFEFSSFTLTCDEATLISRLESGPSQCGDNEVALKRLRQSRTLPTIKIDTTGKHPEEVADEILATLSGAA